MFGPWQCIRTFLGHAGWRTAAAGPVFQTLGSAGCPGAAAASTRWESQSEVWKDGNVMGHAQMRMGGLRSGSQPDGVAGPAVAVHLVWESQLV